MIITCNKCYNNFEKGCRGSHRRHCTKCHREYQKTYDITRRHIKKQRYKENSKMVIEYQKKRIYINLSKSKKYKPLNLSIIEFRKKHNNKQKKCIDFLNTNPSEEQINKLCVNKTPD